MGNIQDTPAIPQYCEYFLAWVIDVAKTSVLDVTAVCTSDLYPLDPLFTVQVLRLQEKKKKKKGGKLLTARLPLWSVARACGCVESLPSR